MPTYYAILTTVGLAKLANALATEHPLVFSYLAVGDGDGDPITPDAAMTSLVNERARVAVNNVEIDPSAPNIVRVEGKIPAATGGFTIREAGLFNSGGDLLAVASYPPIYKTEPGADGVSVDTYIRILLVYSDAVEAVAITVDTSVVVATKFYVDDAFDDLEEDIILKDDFIGGVLDTGKWIAVAGSAMTTVEDYANDGSGALNMAATVGDQDQEFSTRRMVIGTRDFRFRARVRYTTLNTGGRFTLGVDNPSGAFASFTSVDSNLSGRWSFRYGNSPTIVDAAVEPSGTYQEFLIERISGVLTASIDGVVIFTGAMATSMPSAGAFVLVHYGSANATLRVDLVSLRVKAA